MKVGMQIYTVRDHFEKDPAGTLKKIGDMGYKYVELFNHHGLTDPGCGLGISAVELKKMADDAGVDIISIHLIELTHENLYSFYNDDAIMDTAIQYHAEMGEKYFAIPSYFFTDIDYLNKSCEMFNKLGKKCKDSGLQLMYHNHFYDFQTIDGKCIFDLIMENTDPDLLAIELDTYWVMRGLIDPIGLMHKYQDRIKMLHQKDFPLNRLSTISVWTQVPQDVLVTNAISLQLRYPDQFIEIGDGVLKIQEYINVANQYNIEYILVEQDFSTMDSLVSAQRSMDNFKKMHGIEW